MYKIFILSLIFLLESISCYAANITEDDCAIGGVKAGWYSKHHYLPEKFKNTALKQVEWLKSNSHFTLDNYPKSYVVGFADVSCERISLDKSIALYGIMTYKSQSANAGIFQQIFDKSPLYIPCIAIHYSSQIDTSFSVLATNLHTPRGIALLSSADDVIRTYGQPDNITQQKGYSIYNYYTPKTLQRKQYNSNYIGAYLRFIIYNNQVYGIQAYNTYGYPANF
ncbi:MAG: hypothetical protein J6N51_13255 [Selenomonas sp.]|nr:hypothetical protein [Selenomonas sp.]